MQLQKEHKSQPEFKARHGPIPLTQGPSHLEEHSLVSPLCSPATADYPTDHGLAPWEVCTGFEVLLMGGDFHVACLPCSLPSCRGKRKFDGANAPRPPAIAWDDIYFPLHHPGPRVKDGEKTRL